MDNTVTKQVVIPGTSASVSGGDARRPWQSPTLKELKVSHTLASIRPGSHNDFTYLTTSVS
jgi:hypothetical protein